MLPLTNGIESTKVNIFVYSLLMLPVIIFPYVISFVGFVFLIPSLLLTIYYNYLCFDLYKFKKNKFSAKKAKSIFGYSILYLFLVFVLFLIDKILWLYRIKKQRKKISRQRLQLLLLWFFCSCLHYIIQEFLIEQYDTKKKSNTISAYRNICVYVRSILCCSSFIWSIL